MPRLGYLLSGLKLRIGGDAWESNPPRQARGFPATVLKTVHHTSDAPSPLSKSIMSKFAPSNTTYKRKKLFSLSVWLIYHFSSLINPCELKELIENF